MMSKSDMKMVNSSHIEKPIFLPSLQKNSIFKNWKFRMLLFLEQEGLLEAIEGNVGNSENCEIKDGKARMWIVLSVCDNLLDIVTNCKTAREMIMQLEINFQQNAAFSKYDLKKQLLTMKLESSENLQTHFEKFDFLISELEAVGCKLDDSDKVCHLLLTLPEDYTTVVASLDAIMSLSESLMEFTKSRLMDTAMRIKQTDLNSSAEHDTCLNAFDSKQVWKPTEQRILSPFESYPNSIDDSHRINSPVSFKSEVVELEDIMNCSVVLEDVVNELWCGLCGQWCISAAELQNHKQAHAEILTVSARNRLRCVVCLAEFTSKVILVEHFKTHSTNMSLIVDHSNNTDLPMINKDSNLTEQDYDCQNVAGAAESKQNSMTAQFHPDSTDVNSDPAEILGVELIANSDSERHDLSESSSSFGYVLRPGVEVASTTESSANNGTEPREVCLGSIAVEMTTYPNIPTKDKPEEVWLETAIISVKTDFQNPVDKQQSHKQTHVKTYTVSAHKILRCSLCHAGFTSKVTLVEHFKIHSTNLKPIINHTKNTDSPIIINENSNLTEQDYNSLKAAGAAENKQDSITPELTHDSTDVHSHPTEIVGDELIANSNSEKAELSKSPSPNELCPDAEIYSIADSHATSATDLQKECLDSIAVEIKTDLNTPTVNKPEEVWLETANISVKTNCPTPLEKQQSHKQSHAKTPTVSARKRVQCSLCHAGFTSKVNLVEHFKTHSTNVKTIINHNNHSKIIDSPIIINGNSNLNEQNVAGAADSIQNSIAPKFTPGDSPEVCLDSITVETRTDPCTSTVNKPEEVWLKMATVSVKTDFHAPVEKLQGYKQTHAKTHKISARKWFRFRCILCHAGFTSKIALVEHFKSHPTKRNPTICRIKDSSFPVVKNDASKVEMDEFSFSVVKNDDSSKVEMDVCNSKNSDLHPLKNLIQKRFHTKYSRAVYDKAANSKNSDLRPLKDLRCHTQFSRTVYNKAACKDSPTSSIGASIRKVACSSTSKTVSKSTLDDVQLHSAKLFSNNDKPIAKSVQVSSDCDRDMTFNSFVQRNSKIMNNNKHERGKSSSVSSYEFYPDAEFDSIRDNNNVLMHHESEEVYLDSDDVASIRTDSRSSDGSESEVQEVHLNSKNVLNKTDPHISTVHEPAEVFLDADVLVKTDSHTPIKNYQENVLAVWDKSASPPQLSKKFVCDRTRFTSKVALIEHINHMAESSYSNHKQDVITIPDKPIYKSKICKYCGKEFSCVAHMLRHEVIHTGVRNYWCDICNFKFTLRSCLIKHIKTVHEGTKKYMCDICGQRFTSKISQRQHVAKNKCEKYKMLRHEVIHTGERNYMCDICKFKFTLRSSLIKHIKRVHEGEKKYLCDICGKRFTSKMYHRQHIAVVHDKIKLFECELCGQHFGDKTILINHKIVHSGARPFQCEICGKKFRREFCLVRHKERVHEQ